MARQPHPEIPQHNPETQRTLVVAPPPHRPCPSPSLPSPLWTQTNEKGTYYLDLSVLSNLVDLDLLGIGQGVVQGLGRGLRHLTGGGWCGHHGLCGEVQKALATSRRQTRPAMCTPPGFLPSPAPHSQREERKLLLPRFQSTGPNGGTTAFCRHH